MTQPLFSTGPGLGPSPPRASPRQEEQDFVNQFMYWLTAPVILFPGWEDSYKDQVPEAKMRRLAHYEEIWRDKVCTEYEAMLYISSASLVRVPSHHWTQIQLWLFNRCMPEAAKVNGLDDVKDLRGSDKEDLLSLRRWIYAQQVKHLKAKLRAATQKPGQEPEKEVELEEFRL
ncbi:MAG: hypothetical protein U1C72_01270, partial [Candidatus Pacearchaeota archaeon]|nr:hypothetical protein [Candidatus Pacearchaeota archaeon]